MSAFFKEKCQATKACRSAHRLKRTTTFSCLEESLCDSSRAGSGGECLHFSKKNAKQPKVAGVGAPAKVGSRGSCRRKTRALARLVTCLISSLICNLIFTGVAAPVVSYNRTYRSQDHATGTCQTVNGQAIQATALKSFGAVISGVDLSRPQSHDSVERLRELWSHHGVIVFRDQHEISESDLVRFSRYFGELEIHVRKEYLSRDNPEILYVSNKVESGRAIGILSDHEVGWHHDQIYLERPAIGSLLYSVEIPDSGGNTEFINLANAFDALPADIKAQLEALRGVQSYAYFNGQWSEPTSDDQTKQTPDIDHPLIRTHPVSGRKAIYADPGMTVCIKDLMEDESREILDSLFKHAIQDEFQYTHEWRLGDAIMWDNATTMHRRGEFDGTDSRLMKRTTILPPADIAVPW